MGAPSWCTTRSSVREAPARGGGRLVRCLTTLRLLAPEAGCRRTRSRERLRHLPYGVTGGTFRDGAPERRPETRTVSVVDDRLLVAKSRLDRLDWWPRPVRIGRVRLVTAPWAFRLPWLSRFDGFALHGVILLRRGGASTDLVTHELCHVWQMQHRPLRMPLSYLLRGYAANRYERQARAAVDATRSRGEEHRTVP